MILLINIFLTPSRLHGYDRYLLPVRDDRFEVFRYVLDSYATIDRWSKCIFYIQLDQDYLPRKDELENYIYKLFGKEKCSLYWHRNVFTKDWRNASEEVLSLEDPLIWFTCNDDHVFMDYNLEMIDEVITHLINEEEVLSTCYFSHYPEVIRVAALEQEEVKGNFVAFHWNVHDSIQIIRKEVFKSYWYDYDFGDRNIARTDVIHDYTDPKMMVKCYVPTRELCRHYDGYSHVGNFSNVAPPIMIPPGFFEKDMKILYCSHDRRDGWVNINPLASDYYAHNKFGTDYKFMLEDIPLFWKDKISQIEVARKIPRERLCAVRNEAKLAMTTAVQGCFLRRDFPDPPKEWFTAHLRN